MTPLRSLSHAALAYAVLVSAPAAQQEADVSPRHLRVIWTTTPQTTATVSWSTRDAAGDNVLLLAQEAKALRDVEPDDDAAEGATADDDVHHIAAQRNGRFTRPKSDEPARWFYHHATVRGLEPATRYHFRVASDDATSTIHHFTTAPADDREFAILSGGDSRSDPETRLAMNRRIAALSAQDASILALAHGGDYVARGTDLGQWLRWLDDHEATVTTSGRVLPVIPTRGNHEGRGALYDEVWCWPGGDDAVNWFATELSADLLLITLNSETAAGGDQREFLARTLRANADRRWTLVQYHRPLFPAVKSPGRARSHWQPLFDAHDVPLALESDGHVLKRTLPLRGDAPASDGTVYIGEGGLGVPQRQPRAERWYLEPPGMTQRAHHVWLVRCDAERLELRAIGEDGAVLDAATIPAR